MLYLIVWLLLLFLMMFDNIFWDVDMSKNVQDFHIVFCCFFLIKLNLFTVDIDLIK